MARTSTDSTAGLIIIIIIATITITTTTSIIAIITITNQRWKFPWKFPPNVILLWMILLKCFFFSETSWLRLTIVVFVKEQCLSHIWERRTKILFIKFYEILRNNLANKQKSFTFVSGNPAFCWCCRLAFYSKLGTSKYPNFEFMMVVLIMMKK